MRETPAEREPPVPPEPVIVRWSTGPKTPPTAELRRYGVSTIVLGAGGESLRGRGD